MRSFQSSLDSMRQRSGGSSWLSLLVATALGLLLGLFIGWIVWPVEWQGALVSDLAPETRAEYISAVADSYVYSLATSPSAADSARARLIGLGANTGSEVETAIRYFQNRPSDAGSMRVINLIQLANGLALNVNQTAPVVQSVENGGAVVVAPDLSASTTSQDLVATNIAEGAGGSSLLSWLLTLLAALLLLGGGFYLLRHFFQTDDGGAGLFGWRARDQSPDLDEEGEGAPFEDEFDQPLTSVGTGRSNSWVRPLTTQPATLMQQPTARATSWTVGAGQALEEERAEEEAEFSEEDADEVDTVPWEPPPATRAIGRTPVQSQPPPALESRRVSAPPPLEDNPFEDANPFDDDPLEDEAEEDNEEIEADTALRPIAAPLAQHRRAEDTVSKLYEPRAQPTKPGDAPTARFPGAKYVGSYECTYHIGVDEYDESYPVTDPTTQRYIGECGMGVSTKNRILHKNPDEVIALEVWLFDKSDERNISDQMRVLMSEYASDHYADAFIKDRNGDNRPFVAQPRTPFQLEGRNLVLNGEVVAVEYDRNGIFQSVKVKLDVLRR